MEYRLNGKAVPPCMIGTWAWGEGMNGARMIFGKKYDESQLIDTFSEASALGFNMWDTAEVYGMGSSERLLGRCIKGSGDTIISTKHMPPKRFKAGAVKKAAAGSCERLGIDSIDLYWLHLPHSIEENLNEVLELMRAGIVKSVGVSNYSLAEIKKANDILTKGGYRLAAVQNHFSLLSMGREQQDILKWCAENDVIYFGYMVLEQGALSGRYDEKHGFKGLSMRNLAFSKRKFAKISKLLSCEHELAAKYNIDTSQIPIAWAIARGAVPIVGLTKAKYAKQLAEGVRVSLTPEEVARLELLAGESGVVCKGVWEPK